MDELTAALTLARVPAFDAASVTALAARFGHFTEIVRASPATLRAHDIPPKIVDALAAAARETQRDLRWLEAAEHHFVPWYSPRYPPLLKELTDAPVALYVRGNPDSLTLPQLALVGTRNPTPAGRDTAHEFAAHLAQCGFVVTSGLALGIDTASHAGALHAGGQTIAVCGTGLDVPYPVSNVELAANIAASGALVSEFPLGTPPRKAHFPRRNRIISGLSLGTLVIEAAVRSGSLITARLAAEQGREVFAIPGSIRNPQARGCHRLLREGAKLVETTDDIFDELRPLVGAMATCANAPKAAEPQPKPEGLLHKGYQILLDALGFEPAGVDLLVERTGLRADEVASMLLILELEGHVESHPGGLYYPARRKRVK
jgi:DNA processing protein